MTECEKIKRLKELDEMRNSFTESQKRAYSMAMMGESLFLTGGPGTGKSFLTRALITMFEAAGKSVLILAPTGIAAVNIGGTTIHRGLGLKSAEVITEGKKGLEIRARKCPLLDKADVVFVDEISMARRDLFEMLVKCIRLSERCTGKHMQVILVGDFLQLPPVIVKESKELLERYYGSSVGRGYCFHSKEWEELDLTEVALTEPVRQKDPEFINALNQLRAGDAACLSYFNSLSGEDTSLSYLVTTNPEADEINRRKIEELGTRLKCQPKRYQMYVEGKVRKSDMSVPESIELYPGARVMMTVNHPVGRYQNGSCGVVTGFGSSGDVPFVNVCLDGVKKDIRVEPVTWKVTKAVIDEEGKIAQEECGSYTQFPMKLAYAITIHKSQGATFDAVNIDTRCWEASQLYVALSRVRSPKGIHLMEKIKPSSIIVDKSVVNFYKRINGEDIIPQKEETIEGIDDTEIKIACDKKDVGQKTNKGDTVSKKRAVGRPTPFAEGTKRIRVGADSADYIQDICKRQALEGGKIRLIPDELDICITDALKQGINLDDVTFMAIPLEMEGIIRRELKKYAAKSRKV